MISCVSREVHFFKLSIYGRNSLVNCLAHFGWLMMSFISLNVLLFVMIGIPDIGFHSILVFSRWLRPLNSQDGLVSRYLIFVFRKNLFFF